MIDHTNGPPGGDGGGGPTAETADHTTNTIKHHQDGCSHSSGLVVFDWRLAARLTETGLQPVDVALTFTGLAAEMAALTETHRGDVMGDYRASDRGRRDRDPVAEVIEFNCYRDGYAVRFDYDPFLVGFLKKLPAPDRRCVKDWKCWMVATPRARFLAAKAGVLGYTVVGIEEEIP